MRVGLRAKRLLLLSNVNKNWNGSTHFKLPKMKFHYKSVHRLSSFVCKYRDMDRVEQALAEVPTLLKK
jgi:hypothetical protein